MQSAIWEAACKYCYKNQIFENRTYFENFQASVPRYLILSNCCTWTAISKQLCWLYLTNLLLSIEQRSYQIISKSFWRPTSNRQMNMRTTNFGQVIYLINIPQKHVSTGRHEYFLVIKWCLNRAVSFKFRLTDADCQYLRLGLILIK